MTSISETPAFVRPFPALTPAQRLHIEINGYVVVPGVLSADECGEIREALQKIKRDLLSTGDAKKNHVRGAFSPLSLPHQFFVASLIAADPAFTAYATHPRLVGMAEEIIGGEARLCEFNGQINSRNPADDLSAPPTFAFHTGMDVPFGNHDKNGLTHSLFVKTLTNLTDMGPDDGGTVVVAGSHKLDLPDSLLAQCAYADPNLIHQVVAPKGSTLLFFETLIHATGQIRSDNERAIIVAGYGSTLLPWWDGTPLSESFQQRIPPHLSTLLLGKEHWTRGPRYRDLSKPVDARKFTLADGWHAEPDA